MESKQFFANAVQELQNTRSTLLIGPAGSNQHVVTHQVAMALSGSPSQESITVLSANLDPNDDELTISRVSLTGGPDTQVEDVHIGEDDGTEALKLPQIDTILGEAAITLFQLDNPSVYAGELKTDKYGSTLMELYTAKHGDENGFVIDAEVYADILEDM